MDKLRLYISQDDKKYPIARYDQETESITKSDCLFAMRIAFVCDFEHKEFDLFLLRDGDIIGHKQLTKDVKG